jgi:SlyX protein
MNERRLNDLELRYMQLERTVDELSGVVAEQARTIGGLVQQLQQVTQRMRATQEGTPQAGPGDERPPHY